MAFDNKEKKDTKIEFIKSAAMLLLAIILLVGAVFAWFGNYSDVSIEPFFLNIKSEGGGLYLGSGDGSLDRSIVLPCATILGDDKISETAFSKALYVITYDVYADGEVSADLSITYGSSSNSDSKLHYYIDTSYAEGTDSVSNYADIMYQAYNASASNVYDCTQTVQFTSADKTGTQYKRTIAVVFWAGYPVAEGETAVVNAFDNDLTYTVTINGTVK